MLKLFRILLLPSITYISHVSSSSLLTSIVHQMLLIDIYSWTFIYLDDVKIYIVVVLTISAATYIL